MDLAHEAGAVARELEADVGVPALLGLQPRVAADEAPVGMKQLGEVRPAHHALPVRLELKARGDSEDGADRRQPRRRVVRVDRDQRLKGRGPRQARARVRGIDAERRKELKRPAEERERGQQRGRQRSAPLQLGVRGIHGRVAKAGHGASPDLDEADLERLRRPTRLEL